MIELHKAIIKLLKRSECPLLFTEKVIQEVLFYCTIKSIELHNEVPWPMKDSNFRWKRIAHSPVCEEITNILNDTKKPIVRKYIVDKRLPAIYELLPNVPTPDANAIFDRVLKHVIKVLQQKPWDEVLTYLHTYPGLEYVKDGDYIELYIK